MTVHYCVKCSSFIHLKYRYFFSVSPKTLMNFSHFDKTLKILSFYKSSSCIHSQSWTAISTTL